ncbi:MAG TPA: 50S ribosomal protein L23 [Candidatus Paceibacterota bacterium]
MEDTIIKPYITERSTMLSSENVYCFQVKVGATKGEVKDAVMRLYKIKALAVRMVNRKGSVVTRGSRVGRSAKMRKAYVKVSTGTKIEFV